MRRFFKFTYYQNILKKIKNNRPVAFLIFFTITVVLCTLIAVGLCCRERDLSLFGSDLKTRSYFKRCVCENIILRSSHQGMLPPNMSRVEGVPGKEIYRSGMLKAEYIPALSELGIKSILTLNVFTDDTKDKIKAAGIQHIEYDFYAEAMTAGGITQAIETILDMPDPILIHCFAGADRTGIVIAALKGYLGEADIKSLYDEMYGSCHVPFEKYQYYEGLLKKFIQHKKTYDYSINGWGKWMLAPAEE